MASKMPSQAHMRALSSLQEHVLTPPSAAAIPMPPPTPVTPPLPVTKDTKEMPISDSNMTVFTTFLDDPDKHREMTAQVRALLAEMTQQHVFATMPGEQAAVLVMIADALHDPALVVETYNRLRRAKVEPPPVALELTAQACGATGDWPTAKDVIEQMHASLSIMPPNADVFEGAARAALRLKRWIKAQEVLEEMREYDLTPSEQIYIEAIETTIMCEELLGTQTLLKELLETHRKMDVVRVLDDLLDVAMDCEALDHALLLYQELGARNQVLAPKTLEQMAHLAARKQRWHQARVLLAALLQEDPPRAAAPSHSMLTDVDALLETMRQRQREIPLTVYNAALRAYGARVAKEQAVQLLEEMIQRDVYPNTASYAAVMHACGKDVQASEQYYEALKQQGLPMNLDVYHAYILSASRAQEWQMVLKRFEEIMSTLSEDERQAIEKDSRIMSCVAVAHGRAGDAIEMFQVFTAMKLEGVTPNLYVYAEAMQALVTTNQAKQALQLLDYMHKEPIHKDRVAEFRPIWEVAVEAALQCGDEDRLRKLYEQLAAREARVRPHVAAQLIGSLPSEVSAEAIWTALRDVPYLHRVRGHPSQFSYQVLNAVLLRAVGEHNVAMAEKIVSEAQTKLAMHRFNSMTYSLMLTLYLEIHDNPQFLAWCDKMQKSDTRVTVHSYRAFFRHLKELDDLQDERAMIELTDALSALTKTPQLKEHKTAARLARAMLDNMQSQELGVDSECLVHYLGMCKTEEDVQYVFRLPLPVATPDQDQSDVSADFAHVLVMAVAQHAPTLRPQLGDFVLRTMETQSPESSVPALAACCAVSSRDECLNILQQAVQRSISVDDEHLVVFLARFEPEGDAADATDDQVETNTDSTDITARAAYLHAVGVVMETAELELGPGSISLLIQHVLTLARREASLPEVSVAMATCKRLLKIALQGASHMDTSEFLHKIATDLQDQQHFQHILELIEQ